MRMPSRILTLLLPLAFALAVLPALPAKAQNEPDKQGMRRPGVIAAEGTAHVRAAPDKATVRLGVQDQAPTAKDAQAKVNQAMDKILASMKKLGIPANRISTARIDLSPVYVYPQNRAGEPKLTGFRASNTLSVELSLDGKGPAVGPVLDAAVAAGANSVEGVAFTLENETPHQLKALELAGKKARSKAEGIASSLGVRLGRLLHASEGGAGIPPPRPMMMKMAMEDSRGGGASVEPGELTISASVQVGYAIE